MLVSLTEAHNGMRSRDKPIVQCWVGRIASDGAI